MREDMAKVIVERPRRGGGVRTPKGERRREQRSGLAQLRKHEGIKRRWCNDLKGLNENLAPLRRFLRSRCGKPWDKVYGETCERINRNSAVQLHIWQHLVQFVCTSAIVIDGNVCDSRGNRLRGEFYVHPRTRLLCWNRHYRDRHWQNYGDAKASAAPEGLILGWLDGKHVCRLIDGVWYAFEFRPLPESGPSVYDYSARELVKPRPAPPPWESPHIYVAAKRQLNTKEIRRLLSQNE